MFDCDKVNELMSLYIDDELGEAERKEFEEHLKTCESCRNEVAEISQLVYACSELEEEELPDGFLEELHSKLATINEKESTEKKILNFSLSKVRLISTIAACFVVTILAAFLFRSMLLTPSKTSSRSNEVLTAENSTSGLSAQKKAAGETNETAAKTMDAEGSYTDRALIAGDTLSDATASAVSETQKAGPDAISAISVINQKLTADMQVYSGDVKTSSSEIDKLVQEFGGETVVQDSEIMSITAATEQSDNELILKYRIPNTQYDNLMNKVIAKYGKPNVETGKTEFQDTTAMLDELNKQSADLDTQLEKAENNEIELTKDEILNIDEQKKIIAAQIEEIHLQSNFTYLTLTIKKK